MPKTVCETKKLSELYPKKLVWMRQQVTEYFAFFSSYEYSWRPINFEIKDLASRKNPILVKYLFVAVSFCN